MAQAVSVPLEIPPGVVKTRTGEGATGRWSDAQNIRFMAGKPQKRGGFAPHSTTAMLGKGRGMEAWNITSGAVVVYAVGTHLKLYGSDPDGEDVVDITPLRFQQEWVDQLSTTINLGAVSVAMTAHGFSLAKKFVLYGNSWMGGSAVGGIQLNVGGSSSVWELVSVTDANHFKLFPASPTGTLATDPFAVTNTDNTVIVTHTAHGRATGDTVWFAGATAGGGITIAGDYQITKIDANSYSIEHSAPGTSTDSTTGGVAVTYHYSSAAASSVALGGGTVPYYTYLTNPFTTSGSPIVTVSHTAHGARVGDYIHISGASAVAGITLSGQYAITSVVGANSYTVTHTSNANATTTGGGTVLIEYEISVGPADYFTGELRGYGEGPYGAGFYGATEPVDDPTYFDPRTWSIDHAGEDGLMSPLGGSVYYWDSSAQGRADLIPEAPTMLRFIFMTEERHLHTLGIGADGMRFGWNDQDDLGEWVESDINTANSSRRVREGSALIAGAPVGGGMNLIWTDTAVYEHQYTGSKFIYNTRLGSANAGLLAPHAWARTPRGMTWMSQSQFMMWSGSVMPIPNAHDIEDFVFRNIDPFQKSKCFALYDPTTNSVDFYYVPLGGVEPSLYVTVSLDDFSWVNGSETRTTGATFKRGAQRPHKVATDGIVYMHEYGLDADDEAAETYITLAPYELGKGWSDITGFDPDFKRQTGSISLEINTYDRVVTVPVDTETRTIAVGDGMVDLRSSGRHISLTLRQEVVGGDFALDKPQIEIMPGGRRR